MNVVGIDSMIVIWAGFVPEVNTDAWPPEKIENRAEMKRRATILFRFFSRKKWHVILPTIAIAELLVKVPEAEKANLIAALGKRFICPSFDLRAAAIASNLFSRFKSLPADQQYHDRIVLKADTMIIGSVVAAGATAFYSHDKPARRMAELAIKGIDLPTRDPGGGLEFPEECDE